jgi:hypothetical protein
VAPSGHPTCRGLLSPSIHLTLCCSVRTRSIPATHRAGSHLASDAFRVRRRTLDTPKAHRPVTDSFSVLPTPCCSNSGSAHRGCQRRFLPRARRPCCSAECSMTLVSSRAHTTDLPIGERGGWRGRNRINVHCSRPRTGSLDLRGASNMQNYGAGIRNSRCELTTRWVYGTFSPGHNPHPAP